MLDDIVACRQPSAAVVFTDDLQCRADIILAKMAAAHRQRSRPCICVCGERGADCFQAPIMHLPWFEANNPGAFFDQLTTDAVAQKALVFVDSVGALVAFAGEKRTLHLFQTLLQSGCGVYAVVHRHTTSALMLKELQQVCQTQVDVYVDTLLQQSQQQQQQSLRAVVAKTLHSKSGLSKPVASHHRISLLGSGQLHFQSLTRAAFLEAVNTTTPAPTTSTTAPSSAPPQSTSKPPALRSVTPPKSADPHDNLTFNLRLTEEEKAVRAKTALPYAKSHEEKQSVLKGSGAIYYEPDEGDDFDDEDPDDDLDI
eukprot:m.39687 g.39687  ORF g.39687 m.39687 type:complete len:312 (-) comp11639_c0_seq2:302-1237(-)